MRTIQNLGNTLTSILAVVGLFISYSFTFLTQDTNFQSTTKTIEQKIDGTNKVCSDCSKIVYKDETKIDQLKKLYPESREYFRGDFVYVSCESFGACREAGGKCVVKVKNIPVRTQGKFLKNEHSKGRLWHRFPSKEVSPEDLKCECSKSVKQFKSPNKKDLNAERKKPLVPVNGEQSDKGCGKCKTVFILNTKEKIEKTFEKGYSDNYRAKSYFLYGLNKGYIYVGCLADETCAKNKTCGCVVYYKLGEQSKEYHTRKSDGFTFKPSTKTPKAYRNITWHRLSPEANIKSIRCSCEK